MDINRDHQIHRPLPLHTGVGRYADGRWYVVVGSVQHNDRQNELINNIPDGYYEIVNDQAYVMGKHVAWAEGVRGAERDIEMKFEDNSWLWRLRGFHVRTENGFILSTQWGSGNYCDNYQTYDRPDIFTERPTTAELGVFPRDYDGGMIPWMDGDTVCGYVPAGAWWGILEQIAILPTTDRIIPFAIIRNPR
jgi:hypothetical protein